MMRLINGAAEARTSLPQLFAGAVLYQFEEQERVVKEIIAEVHRHGDDAVLEYERKFACPGLSADKLLVATQEIEQATATLPMEVHEALSRAADNIRDFHERQMRQSWMDFSRPGALLGQRYTPISNVGMCVPGQKAPCPSTVLMLAVPARVAGVKRLVMITPPQQDGSVAPVILAAAQIAGVDEIYRVSGAQGVGALAFGTETVPKVDKIVGPGNLYVTLAKRVVYGAAGIESLPGPSEVMIVADAAANAEYAAAELLAQAEHGADSSAILVTNSREVATTTLECLEQQLETLPRQDYARASLEKNGCVVVTKDLPEAFSLVNERAPEHAVLLVENAMEHVGQVRHAGAVFVGPWSPVALGDYYAGPSHVLPTATTARFSSGVGVDDFLKRMSVVCYSQAAFEQAAGDIVTLAEAEGLHAHARAVQVRQQS